MLQWVTAICFSLGVGVASYGILPWPILALGLVVGVLLLVLRFRLRGNFWCSLVVNVFFAGATWFTLRQALAAESNQSEQQTWIESISHSVSDFATERLVQSGVKEENVAVVGAMLLGNRKALSYEQKARFRSAGVQHLLAMSGLHIGIIIGVFSFLFLQRVRYTRWRWPVLLLTLSLLWGYCVVAGMPQSLLRAMLMATLYYLTLFGRGKSQNSINLAHTLLLMLLIDPLCLFDIGTQLSFVAVGALIWLFPAIASIFPVSWFPDGRLGTCLHKVWQLFVVSLAACLGTLPLCMYYFHQFQPWQPLVSVVLVPLTTVFLYMALVLLLFSFTGLWFLAGPIATAINAFLGVENYLLDRAGMLPFGTMTCPSVHWGHVILFYLLYAILLIGVKAPMKARIYAVPSLLFVLLVLYFI